MTRPHPTAPSEEAPHGYEPEQWAVRLTVLRPAGTHETAQLRETLLPHDLAVLRELIEHPTGPDGRVRVLTLTAIGRIDPQPRAWLLRADQLRISQVHAAGGMVPRRIPPPARVVEMGGAERDAVTVQALLEAQHDLTAAGILESDQRRQAQQDEQARLLTGRRWLANQAHLPGEILPLTKATPPVDVLARLVWAEHPTEPTGQNPADPTAGSWVPATATAWTKDGAAVRVEFADVVTPTRRHHAYLPVTDVRRRPASGQAPDAATSEQSTTDRAARGPVGEESEPTT